MLIIRDSFDIFGFGALAGSLGFLLGALGVLLVLSWGCVCSSWAPFASFGTPLWLD